MKELVFSITNIERKITAHYFVDGSGEIMIKEKKKIYLKFDEISQIKLFNKLVKNGMRQGIKEFEIIVNKKRAFADVCVPISGAIHYYENQGLKFYLKSSQDSYIRHTNLMNPFEVNSNISNHNIDYPFDKVWIFKSSDDVNMLVDKFLLATRQSDVLSDGVILGIEWCLNEVMDNVLQHSQAECGYIMGQIHPSSKRLSFCIFDTGIGIFNSFNFSAKVNPETPLDAITLALQERVTRDSNVGQGNGLWGLSNIITQGNGMLKISSCGATYKNTNGNISSVKNGEFCLSSSAGTTTVDFQLDYSQDLNMTKALNGYEKIDLWVESLEDDQDENIVIIPVLEMSTGTGTRKSAEKLRNIILNLVRNNNKNIVLDFYNVNFVSSSFADELIGKIIKETGFLFFVQRFTMKNLNSTIVGVINRSVEQRMAQIYFDYQFEEIEDFEEFEF